MHTPRTRSAAGLGPHQRLERGVVLDGKELGGMMEEEIPHVVVEAPRVEDAAQVVHR